MASVRERALISLSSSCGHHGAGGRSDSRYRRRAIEYWMLDLQYRDRSRFLAAAAMVSCVLGLVERYAFFVVGRPGVRLLSHIGASLKEFNVRLVDRWITVAGCTDLDERWVRLEQAAVQRILQAQQADHPERFAAGIRGIDRLLAFAACGPPIGSAQALLLGQVVRRVARTHAEAVRFINQRHRECIGMGLIAEIRGAPVSPGRPPSKRQGVGLPPTENSA